jgi:hypothetical protein
VIMNMHRSVARWRAGCLMTITEKKFLPDSIPG